MTAPIIISIVFACLIALLVFLLSVRIRFEIVGKNTDLKASMRVLFYKRTLYPEDTTPKRILKKDKKKSKKEDKRKRKLASQDKTAPEKKKKRSILQIVRLIMYMLKRLYAHFPKYLKLRLNRVVIAVGGKDAAATAIQYGAVRAAVSYFLTYCEDVFTIKTPRNATLLIEPNYLTDESMCDIKMDLSISLFSAIRLFYRAYPIYRAGKKKHMSIRKTPQNQSKTKNKAD